MTGALYLSRATLRRDPSAAALAALFDPEDDRAAPDAQRRAIWSLFADHPDRRRDFLWRADGRGRFYVLSRRIPEDRHGLFVLETQPFEAALAPGDVLAFSLRANAVVDRSGAKEHRRVDVVMHALRDVPGGGTHGRAENRMELAQSEGRKWLERQGSSRGFAVEAAQAEAYRTAEIPRRRSKPVRFGVLDLAGRLRVTEPDTFLAAVASGFGKARAFGCGLMMIRRG